MKSELEVLGGLSRKVKIEVPMDLVQAEFREAYQSIRKTANIKGFRKGKAPMNVVANMYKEQITPEVLQRLIQKGYATALDTHNLDPISYPNIEYDQFLPDHGFFFSAQFEIRPEVKLLQLEGLKVKSEQVTIAPEKVDEVIDNIRKSRSQTSPILEDRGVVYGDLVTMDFAGTIEGNPLDGGSAQDYSLEIGSNQFIPGFEDGLVGMKPGEERVLNLSFPDEYQATELAGKPVEFRVKVNKIEKKELPLVDDAFVASLGGPMKTVAELRQHILEDLKKSEEKRIRDDLKNRVLKVLVEENPVEVPQSLLADQKKALIDDVHRRMHDQGMNHQQFEEYKTKWDADFTATANQMIQSSFLIDAIAKAHNLASNEEDFNKKLAEYAIESGLDLTRLKQFYTEEKNRDRLAYQLTEEKVINFILDKADITLVSKEKLED